MTPANRVPVIALTGYLGAGKTSLLNHLLLAPGARLGVVVNDFGVLNVDAALVTGQIDKPVSISGGCLCCMPSGGGLDEALEKLSQPTLRLDAILVEASGVANPPVLAKLIRSSAVERIRPGGVIEVIDAVEHFRTVDAWPEPPLRYAAATLVVIGKTDLLPSDEREAMVERIHRRVRERNPCAPIVVARDGQIDPALVFDTASKDEPQDELPIGLPLREEAHDHVGHEHARSASVQLGEPVAPGALMDLLEEPPEGAYRMKGRVRVRGPRGERGYLVNVVGPMIHIMALAEPPEVGELVAIGLHLDAVSAERALQAVADAHVDHVDAHGWGRLQRHRRLSE
ncbi:CobW family GTP-binding protein [Propionibacterium sp.]|uniref:CobW family GTP-binding protein n=1 Tax=Propionibacterium sp. TaxID=1977903 RepID=UPI0039ED8FEF